MPGGWGGTLAVAVILLPLAGSVGCFLLPRLARSLTMVVAGVVLVSVLWLVWALLAEGPLRYAVGGWGAPLGIDLRVDGLAVFMLLITALTGTGIAVYALRYFQGETGEAEGFWPLWLLLWAAMNALYVSADIFNLYVTLELMGLAAVVLVALASTAEALTGAMRYLLTTMLASLTYLLGVGLLYHLTGTLDLALLGRDLPDVPAATIALGLMIAALLVKSALFPLHFWLPGAHASAPSPVSALLSALVVKATIYLLIRLWLDVVPGDRAQLGSVLASFGAVAILWGSVQALRQAELKLLVAYSTVAQLGYLFVPFAIAPAELATLAWRGALYFALCHALAKAAMFMAVGNFVTGGSSGRLHDLPRTAGGQQLSLAAFGVAGITIIGLPPSGGFIGKWMLLEASFGAGHWWLAAVILLGGLLSAAYVFRVVSVAFSNVEPDRSATRAHPQLEWVALILALATLVLGFVAPQLLRVLEVGAPLAVGVAIGEVP